MSVVKQWVIFTGHVAGRNATLQAENYPRQEGLMVGNEIMQTTSECGKFASYLYWF